MPKPEWIPAPRPDLSLRAEPETLPERMDQPCSYEDLQACLRDIAQVNKYTFEHRPTLWWMTHLLEHFPTQPEPFEILDVGCGYGENLRRLHQWAASRKIPMRLTGIDLNPDAIRAAREATPDEMDIRWIHADVFEYEPETEIDVVLSSLLTHHLAEAQIVRFLRWMEVEARCGWFINDLHRMPVPYKAFQLLVKMMPLHPFVQYDGLASIRRSFIEDDWQRMCAAAGFEADEVSIRVHRPARLCVGRIKA